MIELDRQTQERLLGRRVEAVLTDRRTATRSPGSGCSSPAPAGRWAASSPASSPDANPPSSCLMDHAEYGLFRVGGRDARHVPAGALSVYLGDVSRRVDMGRACREARPHVVFHAAAYKHVTLAEHAVVAAARTNVLGTIETLARAPRLRRALRLHLHRQGGRAAQRDGRHQALRRAGGARPGHARSFRPIVTRFGNILGSSGSVVEIMLRRAARAARCRSPTRDATRFFMTGEEAAALVMKADRIGEGGEVFWLDMGEPIRIGDLAERVIALGTPAGGAPRPIETIGLRPGEKMSETLTAQGLEMRRTSYPADLARAAAGRAPARRSTVRCGACGGPARRAMRRV